MPSTPPKTHHDPRPASPSPTSVPSPTFLRSPTPAPGDPASIDASPRPRRRLAAVLAAGAGMATVSALTVAEVSPAADAVTTGHQAAVPQRPGHARAARPGRHRGIHRLLRHRPAATVHTAAASAPVLADPTTGQPADGPAGPPGTDLGTFTVTCYAIHGRTASGDEAGPQSVAVDPSVIPLGAHLYIGGVGYRTADDTGGSVKGHHIDIWESTTSACESFGVQYRDVRRVS